VFTNRAFNYFFVLLIFSCGALEHLHNGRMKRKTEKRELEKEKQE
jgi:hypothetical protein